MSPISARIARPSMALRPAMLCRTPAVQRGFRVSSKTCVQDQEPRSKPSSEQPMASKGNSQSMIIGATGLGLGGAFFYLMSAPRHAKEQPVDGVKAKPISPK
ncbi:hypothetical protein FZEAL_8211 [Fusarium zealandicum]|uniref:Uncharacterized protein n=1 Tax=Fusarium zealandicum TaxID=1053134 RepID=A0A8H4UFA1_9HYPO|nr:hypothetical protein FZEAL_8211 [Fusarium zealandicum]